MSFASKQKMSIKCTKGVPGPSRIPTSGRDSGTHSRSSSVSNLTTASDVRSEVGDALTGEASNFKVDDRVWVNGTKPGIIKFLGKTQFSPGIWAGILLEEAAGKNDGSVGGVKYFECEPLKGIFARPNKLTKGPALSPVAGDSPQLDITIPRSSSRCSGSIPAVTSTCKGYGMPSISPISPKGVCSRLRLGQQVVVNSTAGVKTGTLRFLGETDFAKGDWAGIELSEALGKNDGTVAGKRYFQCKMKHGLFAPLHKVSHAGGTATPKSSSFVRGAPLTSHMRAGSRDSLNSTISNASRSSRVKLGVMSLTNSQKSLRAPGSGIVTTSRALEEAIKEKEQHIEQLLKERDLERAEVARAASQYEEVKQKFSETNTGALELIKNCEKAEAKCKEVEEQLSKDQRKLEDLQFQLEEELIAKGDLEIQLQQKNMILKRLEEFGSKELGEKFVNVQEILKGQECLSEVTQKQDSTEQKNFQEQICRLENELQKTLDEKIKLSLEVAQIKKSLEQLIAEKTREISTLGCVLQEQEKEIEALKLDLNSSTEKAAQINLENSNLKEQIILQESQTKQQANAVVTELKEKTQLLKNELETLSIHLKEKEKSIEEKDAELLKTNRNMENLSEELVKLQSDIRDLNVTVTEYEMEKSEMQKSSQGETASLKAEAQLEISKKEQEIVVLMTKIESLTNQLQMEHVQVKQKENNVKDLQQSLGKKNELVVELNSKLQKAEETLSNSNEINQESTSELANKLLKSKEENDRIKLELEEKIQQISGKLKIATSELQEKKESASEQELQVSSLNQSLSEKENACAEADAECNTLKEKYRLICQEKEANEMKLEEQLKIMRADLESAVKSKEEAASNFSRKDEQLHVMAAETKVLLSEKENERKSLLKMMDDKAEEITLVNSKLELAEQKIEMLNKDSSDHVMALQDELSRVKGESDATKTNLKQELMASVKDLEEKTLTINKKEIELKEKVELLGTLQNTIKEHESQALTLSSQLQDFMQKYELLSKVKVESQILYDEQLADVRKENEMAMQKKEQLLESLKNELAQYTQLNETTHNVVQKKNSEIDVLKNMVKEKESQFEELTGMIEASQTQLVQLKQLNEKNVDTLNSKESYINEFKNKWEKQLLEKEQELKGEISRLEVSITAKEEEVCKKEERILNLTSKVEQQEKQVGLLHSELQNTKVDKERIQKESSEFNQEFSLKVTDLEEKYNKLLAEKEKIAKEELTTRDAKKGLEKMRDSLLQEKGTQEEIAKDREAKLQILQAEVNRMQAEFSQHKQELEQKLDVSQMEVEAANELKTQLDVQHSVLEELQQKLHDSDEKRKKLELQIKDLQSVTAEKSQLEKKLAELNKVVKENGDRVREFEDKNGTLEKLLNHNQTLLQEKEKQLLNLNKQLEPLQSVSESSDKLKSSVRNLEGENSSLKIKVALLETYLKEKNDNASEEAASNQPTTDQERESLYSQIDFLNSIIVDMKQKNEHLTQKLEQQSTLWDESDPNLNGIKTELAPRLFCDICDMFDIHDTEDCPKQESLMEDDVPALKAKSPRKSEERPYCNNCEMFGHWTLECVEQETF